jgi:hypothetical protein
LALETGNRTGPNGGIGNGTFNMPVLVEAADTGPFFHNNAVATIEAAVTFYTGPEFNYSPAGNTVRGISLTPSEVSAVAAFLRAINALENIRSAIDLEERAKGATSFPQVQELLKLAISEIEDAFEVLDGAALHPKAQGQLNVAADKAGAVKANHSIAVRNSLIDESLEHINTAKSEIVN